MNMTNALCWDQIAEGYSIPNIGKKCEGIKHSVGDNKCTGFLPWVNP
jgi:hypothetical protein